MNKPTIFIFILANLLLFACNNKTGDKTAETPAPQVETPKEESTQDSEETPEMTEEKPYVMASIRKTPCYGKCPVFEAKFYSDGRATYAGKMNVDKIGEFTGRVNEATMKSIKSKAMEVGYLDFLNEYPTGEVKIADVPTTHTSIRIGDMVKAVSNKYQGPEGLKVFEDFLMEIVDRVEWTKSMSEGKK